MRPHRRDFLKSSLAVSTLVSMGAGTVPLFLNRTARAARNEDAKNDRILVVVQLLGGNDGLNTVVPYGIDGYTRGRRVLRLPTAQLHKIDDAIGLHPGLGQFNGLLEADRLAIVQGVGYPNPDRSHFRSMEIWETARLESSVEACETGWLGRMVDARPAKPGEDSPALHIGGGRLPIALRAKSTEAPSLETLEQFRLRLEGSDDQKRAARTALGDVAKVDRGTDDALLGFLRRSTLAAYESSQRLEKLAKPAEGKSKYPEFGLAKRLELIAQIIKAGFGTRVYYTRLDGFDTHANQLASHAALLTELGDSLAAFDADLKADGQGDRVAVLCFSEFGRRVAENASAGTDHGAAAPAFVVGPVAKAGLIGGHPSMEPGDLDDGDLKHAVDFRSIYAGLLDDWLGLPSGPIVGDGIAKLGLLRGAMT